MVDLDKLFENYFRKYVLDNAGKFTEEELEDKVGELYEEFGNTPLKELGGKTPTGFFADMKGKELVDALNACVNENIPVSDYLCEAIEKSSDSGDYLLKNVNPYVSDELATYSLNLLNAKGEFSDEALNNFVKIIACGEAKDSLTELLTETLTAYADKVKEAILGVYDGDDPDKKYFIEILANTVPPDDRVFNILIDEIKKGENVALLAAYLSKYGDDRAVTYLNELAKVVENYIDYKEIQLAVEALGGELEEERDFTSDPIYKKLKH